MDQKGITRSQMAKKLGVPRGSVSRTMNHSGNMTVKTMVGWVRALGLKLAVLAYDDPENNHPVFADLFVDYWKLHGKPTNWFDYREGIFNITVPQKGTYNVNGKSVWLESGETIKIQKTDPGVYCDRTLEWVDGESGTGCAEENEYPPCKEIKCEFSITRNKEETC